MTLKRWKDVNLMGLGKQDGSIQENTVVAELPGEGVSLKEELKYHENSSTTKPSSMKVLWS